MTDTPTGTGDLIRRLRAQGFDLTNEAADALEAVERLLREVNDKGLIYWEPQTDRGYRAKADMMSRIENLLARHATGQRKGGDAEGKEQKQSAWDRRPDETEAQWRARCRNYEFMAFDPDNPDVPLD